MYVTVTPCCVLLFVIMQNVVLSSHEYVFWCGDLNYRIDLTIDKVKEAIVAQNWSLLQKHDQLLKSKYNGKVCDNCTN